MLTRMLAPVAVGLPLAVTLSALVTATPAVAAMGGPVPALQRQPGAPDPVWIIAAGDIPPCGDIKKGPSHIAQATGDLAMSLKKLHSSAEFLGLGDQSNGTGTASEYLNCYNLTKWSKLYSDTYPSPGNHEYQASGTAAGYFWYFKDVPRLGKPSVPYYSFDMGAWHFISLDSECTHAPPAPQPPPALKFKGCDNWPKIKSAQEAWLSDDLQKIRTAHPTTCILAFWHEPLFSSSSRGPTGIIQNRPEYPLWKILHKYRAAIVLNGHLHGYERFDPQNEDGKADDTGMREFVPATGGSEFYKFNSPTAHSARIIPFTPGALLLELQPNLYRWEFYDTTGKVRDSSQYKSCPVYKK